MLRDAGELVWQAGRPVRQAAEAVPRHRWQRLRLFEVARGGGRGQVVCDARLEAIRCTRRTARLPRAVTRVGRAWPGDLPAGLPSRPSRRCRRSMSCETSRSRCSETFLAGDFQTATPSQQLCAILHRAPKGRGGFFRNGIGERRSELGPLRVRVEVEEAGPFGFTQASNLAPVSGVIGCLGWRHQHQADHTLTPNHRPRIRLRGKRATG